MSKTVFTIVLPEPRVRKASAPPEKPHKNKRLYARKPKHKNQRGADDDCAGQKRENHGSPFLV